ncbi:MAG: hypothetical protein ROO73_01270 [Roseivirga sp.]
MQHEQGRLLIRISSLQAGLSALDSEPGHEDPLCYALTELHERTEKIVGAEIEQVGLEVKIRDRFGRGVNERHPIKNVTPLQEAVIAGDIEGLKMLLPVRGIELNKRLLTQDGDEPDSQSTPLILSIMYGNKVALQLLLEAGADPNYSYVYSQEMSDEPECVWFHMVNNLGFCDFYEHERQEVCDLLLRYGWDVDYSTYEQERVGEQGVTLRRE